MGMSKKATSEIQQQITLSAAVVADATAGDDSAQQKKCKKRKDVVDVQQPAVEVVEKKKRRKHEAQVASSGGAEAQVANEMDAATYRAKMQIKIASGADVPDPIQSFDNVPFGKKMRNALKEAGFAAPSGVQAQAWPLAAQGCDLVSVAKTGSGKTLAFILPAFRKISKEKLDGSAGPAAVVLAPTRELAQQIEQVAEKFGACMDIKTVTVFGGVPKPPQAKALRAGPQLVVATPGRLMDLMEDGSIKLGSVKVLVLDEADRMLDMGFEPQMEKIMKQIPAERQTLLFSATWPKAVQKLAKNYLKADFVHVNVGETEDLAANKAVSQEFFKLGDDEKEAKLHRILYDMGEGTKIIIFANTKNRINNLQKAVWKMGYDCVAMHGDKAQWERDEGLAKFTKNEIPVMLATDVCSRGLDIKDVSHVLNFDMARDVESYVHRIGRTGRAGKTGTSITFFNDAYDIECAPALAKIAKEAGQEVPAFLEKAAEKGANTKNKLWKY